MRSALESLLVLSLLVMAVPAAAQTRPDLSQFMKRSDDVVLESSVDGEREETATAAPSRFVPLSGLQSSTVPTAAADPSGERDGEEEAEPEGDGARTSITWSTLWVVKPSAGPLTVPDWWSEPSKSKASKAKANKPKKSKPGRKKDKDDGKSGDLQQRIVDAAQDLVGKRFPYAPGTEGGRLGCANVVSAALRKAGAMKSIMLGVLAVNADLKKRGWREVKPPPWRDGDVISWATYDRTGDGRTDPDTHIGIISVQGGTVYAINNSSSKRVPVKVPLKSMGYPVTTVLRKA